MDRSDRYGICEYGVGVEGRVEAVGVKLEARDGEKFNKLRMYGGQPCS